jgi:hypothetical protein
MIMDYYGQKILLNLEFLQMKFKKKITNNYLTMDQIIFKN